MRVCKALTLLAAVIVLIISAPVNARPGHGGVASGTSSLCFYGVNNTTSPALGAISDGCPNAPTGTPDNITLIQHPAFFSGYANQSGQTYSGAHPPAWNVAGVDYPVGIPKTVTLKDPATYSWSGTGCTYSPTGSGISGPLLSCNAVTGALTLDGFDFSGTIVNPGSHGCVTVFAGAQVGFQTLIKNSYFTRNSGCWPGNNNSGAALALYCGSHGSGDSCEVDNCVFDFSPAVTGTNSSFQAVSPYLGTGGTITFKYNAFINVPQRIIAGDPVGPSLLMEYNYVENYVFDVTNQGHGEVTDLNGGGTWGYSRWFFNTILRGSSVGSGSGTANIWMSPVVAGGFTEAEALNNITVDNCTLSTGSTGCRNGLSGYETQEASLIYFNYTQTQTYAENNWDDYTGALYVGFAATPTVSCTVPIVWSNNKNLIDGTVISGFTNQGQNGC